MRQFETEKSVNFSLLLQLFTGQQSNESYVTQCTKFGLKIHKSVSTLVSAFSDADWAGSTDGERSTMDLQCFWDQILYHGVQGNRVLCHTLVMWIQTLIKELHIVVQGLLSYGVTTLVKASRPRGLVSAIDDNALLP
jgi:hypothetical protein